MRYLLLLLLLSSCSTSFHCRKCFDKAEVKTDTLKGTKEIAIPGREVDSTLNFVTLADSLEWANWSADVPTEPVIIYKDKLKIELRFLPGEKIYVKGECLPDTLKIEVPVLVENEIKTGMPTGYVLLLVLGALLAGGLLVKMFG